MTPKDAQRGLGETSREQGPKAELETPGGIVTWVHPPLALCAGDMH